MREEIGGTYNFLTITGRTGHRWHVRCVCGIEKTVQRGALVSNYRPTKSCGCKRLGLLRAGQLDHGHSLKTRTPEYRTFITWQSMLWRCYNKARNDYPRYGGRGVTVCDRWKESYDSFLSDMGIKPDGYSLGRINNDGNYEPSNCRWETVLQQARNRCTSRLLTWNGITHNLSEWAERVGIDRSTIEKRLDDHGWSVEKALSTPVRGHLRIAYG